MTTIDWTALDYDDPCALLAVLRPAYYQLVAGEKETEVTYEGSAYKLHLTSIEQVRSVVRELEQACLAKQGKTPTRFAGVGGYRRPW